ncbi:MAG: porin [Gemmataceae bacterium]
MSVIGHIRLGMMGCLLGFLFLPVPRATAGDDKVLRELLERVEKLEKQNEELRKKLIESGPAGPYKPPAEVKDKETGKEKEKIEKVIDSYLKDQEKKKQEQKAQQEDEGYEVGKQLDAKARWTNHQLWVESEDKAFRFHLGGRLQFDAVFVHAPQRLMVPLSQQGIGEFDDAINFRRARLAAEGTLWEVFDFNCEYDFVNTVRIVPAGQRIDQEQSQIAGTAGTSADRNATINTPVPTDLWGQIHGIPVIGNIRAGNQKQWISMEHLTSSRFLDFLERSLAFDAFLENGNNGFVPGISAWRTLLDDRMHVGAGVYWPNFRDIFGWDVGDGERQYVARVAGLPIFEENGRYLLHLGLAYMHSTADDGVIRFRARPMTRNGPAVLHNIIAQIQGQLHNYNLVVPELLVNCGPFTFASEYYGAWVDQRPGAPFTAVGTQTASRDLPRGGRGPLFYQGGYVQVGYFLTGESRGYEIPRASEGRQVPYENAFFVDGEEGCVVGRGGWEVLARYEYLDLNSQGVNGGVLHGSTLGVNWFLNPNAKVQVNYTLVYRDATQYKAGAVAPDGNSIRDGLIQGLGTRLAFDF